MSLNGSRNLGLVTAVCVLATAACQAPPPPAAPAAPDYAAELSHPRAVRRRSPARPSGLSSRAGVVSRPGAHAYDSLEA